MDVGTRQVWAWNARKWVVSAFLVMHLAATLIWVLPSCPLRERCRHWAGYYLLPLGMWQYWGMFAPDPMKESITLEAEVIDSKGLRYGFAFPKLADYSPLAAVPRFRHSKYAANLLNPDTPYDRAFAARHVARQLALPAEAFPVNVTLIYHLKLPPPPGGPPADPMAPTTPYAIGPIPVANLSGVTQ
jgi:hypothetical protein